jgi:hypothetical protein
MTRYLGAVLVLAIALSCTGGAKQGSDETIMAGVGTAWSRRTRFLRPSMRSG